MHVKDCCITELLDKPGLVQINGLCKQCNAHVAITVCQKSLETWIEQGNMEGSSLNAQNRMFLMEGICCKCQANDVSNNCGRDSAGNAGS